MSKDWVSDHPQQETENNHATRKRDRPAAVSRPVGT
jgi:hypothetical protein